MTLDLAGGKINLCKCREKTGGRSGCVFVSKSAIVAVFYVVNVSHRCAYLSLMSAIVASASVIDIGHWRGISVFNVSHRCGCHRPRRWPLLQLQPSPISFSTLAVVVVVAIINVGHHCGRCRRQHQLVHLQSHCCY